MVWQTSAPKGEACFGRLTRGLIYPSAEGGPASGWKGLSFYKLISRLDFFWFSKNPIRNFDINLNIRIGYCRTS